MAFYLPRNAKAWFKEIRKDMDLDFDVYNLCLLAGLKAKVKRELRGEETTELTDNFPGGFREYQREIIALLLAVELEKAGLAESDRRKVHDFVGRLIDPYSPSGLSLEGQRELNRYCWGGFEVISEWFGERPHHIEAFLPMFWDRMVEGGDIEACIEEANGKA